ncbi:putative dehydrogenase [Saccharopolyspora erythraea NRRL 2338]|uniref:Glycosyl hydrolase family 109 protein n=2 Tax=Saccharopolyspora erythraea TaxID=1836 RepID=GH109_SACEN|nr:Gfo/Idh/MocA family oxidoreductase [Saccharopolyspora erythraea]A4FN60.1 RecName: Full=Glycosyl hydrolase family 109 protein; Flags: Precursor [Saccharopolyspora erythraea NRRL 2338]EQD84444.1 glycosyl hydrolase [Saccharopolyspora erythraea D]PFG99126.1 putative dehydrogenase [Saccharopolyspora erythraea NRRL 2338]QRK89084.1 Gfo/Idh/MocA family oxidoreductase [Saccharopolyspora erythraea]CAM05485.1 twin-arginine translocation pathway signal [Saccharopolyspora erythraea NRRL 2338]
MAGDESRSNPFSRRTLLRTSAAAGAGLGVAGLSTGYGAAQPVRPAKGESMMGVAFEAHETVRVGIIGVGNRGASMLPLFLAVPGVAITAVCDVSADAVNRAARAVTDAGHPEPAKYSAGEDDFENLLRRDDVDFAYVATPWEWHTPMALSAMRNGKHVGVECPAGTTVDELWELVDTSEKTRRHCIQLENCSYSQNEMRVLRMVHDGLFGQVLFGAGAYLHDLRELLFSKTYYAGQWRRAWHTGLNGDLYPTHGLGPVAAYMDINRGDRLVRITSMSTPAAGLAQYREQHMPAGDPTWNERYVKGDATISLIQTEAGRVVQLAHDVSNPRPYSRLNQLQGTNGVFEDYPARIYLEPTHSNDEWGDFAEFADYDHWLWKEVGPGPGGHGGMDYIMLYRLAQTMRLGLPPDIDVYDSATWSAPFALSVESVRRNSAPVDFPDFTRGRWQTPHPGVDSPKPA